MIKILFVSLMVLRWILPKVQWFFSGKIRSSEDFFQQEFRAVFLIMIGTVIIFEILGLHPIIAGFFSGLVLSGSIQSEALKEKIRVVSYGLFIPIFFIVIGTQTNIGVFAETREIFLLVAAVVIGLIV